MVCSGTTFELTTPEKTVQENWVDIVRLTAYKADDFTVDTLCVEIILSSGQVVTIDEDIQGFDAFLEGVQQHLDCNPNSWMPSVLYPAFAENRTVIFSVR